MSKKAWGFFVLLSPVSLLMATFPGSPVVLTSSMQRLRFPLVQRLRSCICTPLRPQKEYEGMVHLLQLMTDTVHSFLWDSFCAVQCCGCCQMCNVMYSPLQYLTVMLRIFSLRKNPPCSPSHPSSTSLPAPQLHWSLCYTPLFAFSRMS